MNENEIELKVCKSCDAPLPFKPEKLAFIPIVSQFVMTVLILTMRIRKKKCFKCNESFLELFRCKNDSAGEWIFLCKKCLQIIKKDSLFYQYGGTWKSKKK